MRRKCLQWVCADYQFQKLRALAASKIRVAFGIRRIAAESWDGLSYLSKACELKRKTFVQRKDVADRRLPRGAESPISEGTAAWRSGNKRLYRQVPVSRESN